MEKSTISMVIFHIYVSHYQMVNPIKIPSKFHSTTIFLWFSLGFPMVFLLPEAIARFATHCARRVLPAQRQLVAPFAEGQGVHLRVAGPRRTDAERATEDVARQGCKPVESHRKTPGKPENHRKTGGKPWKTRGKLVEN